MKVGILTFHNIPNYGAALQAVALCNAVSKLGYECEIINYKCENIVERELVPKKFSNPLKTFKYRYIFWPKEQKRIKGFWDFMLEVSNISDNIYTQENIGDTNKVYSCFITGSDQIWNLKITNNDFNYFLKFVEDDKKKVAVGSSAGEKWAVEKREQVSKLLKRFNAIGCREKDVKQLICELGIDAQWVCDPTMLLTPEEWRNMIVEPSVKDYVFVYYPNAALLEAAHKYAKKRGLKVFVLNIAKLKTGEKNIYPNSPAEWMGIIANAEAIFTDSYHGLLFSLYFNRPVWTTCMSNRQKSVVEKLNLSNVMLNEDPNLENEINYEEINKNMSMFRNETLEFLKNIFFE